MTYIHCPFCTDYVSRFFKISLFMTYNSDNQQKNFAFLPLARRRPSRHRSGSAGGRRVKPSDIAGPMTGLPEFNYPASDAAEVRLRAEGFRGTGTPRAPKRTTRHPACREAWDWYMRHAPPVLRGGRGRATPRVGGVEGGDARDDSRAFTRSVVLPPWIKKAG